MSEKPEQPDLFEWKPKKKPLRRLFDYLKSDKFFWKVFWMLFALVIFIDNALLVKFINFLEIYDDKNLVLISGALTVFGLAVYTYKRPQNVFSKLKSGYFWLFLWIGVQLLLIRSDHGLKEFLGGFVNHFLFTFGLLIAIGAFLLIKKPPFFAEILRSRIFLIWLTTFSLLFLLRFDDEIAPFALKYWLFPTGIALVAGSLLAIWYIPIWFTGSLKDLKGDAAQSEFEREEKRLKLADDTRKTIATIIGGLFVVIGAVFTYSNYELSAEGQVTNRFSNSVILLKDDDSSVRLGGLYALERISKDSPKDYPTIMEILASYVRERSRLEREKAAAKASLANNNSSVARNAAVNARSENSSAPVNARNAAAQTEFQSAPVDLLAAAEIIRRRESKNDKQDSFFDLSNANLNGAQLYDTNLDQANLEHAKLRKVNFSSSRLNGTKFNRADLTDANLQSTNGYRLEMESADLTGADLTGASLQNTNFSKAVLKNTVFVGAPLYYSNFEDTELDHTNFGEADLGSAYFSGAVFIFTDLSSADLRGANFLNAEFRFPDLRNAKLDYAKNLTFEQLSKAIINEYTILPGNLLPRRAELLAISNKNREKLGSDDSPSETPESP